MNKGYWSGSYRDACVETKAPGKVGFFLARWACGEWGFRLVEIDRVGFVRWRYRLAGGSTSEGSRA